LQNESNEVAQGSVKLPVSDSWDALELI
jgi:hypothetical protein